MDNAKRWIAIFITLAEQGGAQSFVFEFAKWLTERENCEVTVYAGAGEWLKDKLINTSIKFVRVPHLSREIEPWSDLKATLWLTRELKRAKPDVLHLNSAKGGLIGSVAARFSGVRRVVYRIGGWTFLEQVSKNKKALYRLLERWTAPLKNAIVCVHEGDVETARAAGIRPKEKIVAIPNGLDIASFDRNLLSREQARNALALPPDVFVYGVVANFYPAKALPAYLDACATIAKTESDARFAILGDGPERGLIEKRRRDLGLEQHVLLLGNRDDAANLLAAFDVFVLPSTKEGMSWALLEAMAARLPCVATDVGANRWMLESGAGWIVPSGNIEALSAAMREAKREKNLAREKALCARATVIERFPLERTLRENAKILL